MTTLVSPTGARGLRAGGCVPVPVVGPIFLGVGAIKSHEAVRVSSRSPPAVRSPLEVGFLRELGLPPL